MPCDSIQTSKVQFIQGVTDINHLMESMRKLGYVVTKNSMGFSYYGRGISGQYQSSNGKFTTRGYDESGVDIDEIKRGYSVEVANDAAEQMGWQIQWSTNSETGFPEAEVIKRR